MLFVLRRRFGLLYVCREVNILGKQGGPAQIRAIRIVSVFLQFSEEYI